MELDWKLAGQIIWFAFLVVWYVVRWIPNRRSRKVKIAFSNRKPRELIAGVFSWTGLFILPVVWVVTGWPENLDYTASPFLIIIGIVIFFASLRLFRITHKALGAMWSHSLDLRENHRLVTAGIYQRVRHPMYSAFFLWALAQAFLLSNWAAGFSGLVGFGTLYFLRVGMEEKMMEDQFGDEYRAYCAKTKRIIPGIY